MQAGVATKTVVRSGGGFCCVSFGLLLEQVPCLFKTMFCSFCYSEKKLILDLSNFFFFFKFVVSTKRLQAKQYVCETIQALREENTNEGKKKTTV